MTDGFIFELPGRSRGRGISAPPSARQVSDGGRCRRLPPDSGRAACTGCSPPSGSSFWRRSSDGEKADPEECKTIANLGVDFLAAGIGNIHGIYPADWKGLDLNRLAEIQEATNGKPLVLHGGTGIPYPMVRSAIERGVSKVNINTDLQLAFARGEREYFEAGKDQDLKGKGFDPRKLLKPGCEAIKAKVEELLKEFGSYGKAA